MKKLFAAFFLSAMLATVACGPSSAPEKNDNTPQQATLYQCPMKCEGEKTYDKPGQCPVCGMDLKPVEVTAPAIPDSSGHGADSTRSV